MTVWRPPSEIKVKVVGLVWRDDQLLLVEVEDDTGGLKGLRPPGGSIEFGEAREAALQREFEEELGSGVTLEGPWHCFENIYEHEGAVGHEFVFAVKAHLTNAQLYLQDSIRFVEADLISCRAGWFRPSVLPADVDLYPTGLLPLVENGPTSPAVSAPPGRSPRKAESN